MINERGVLLGLKLVYSGKYGESRIRHGNTKE